MNDWTIERDYGKRGVEVNSKSLNEQWFVLDEIIEPLVKFYMTTHLREWFLQIVRKYE